jgi:hypothetical protein
MRKRISITPRAGTAVFVRDDFIDRWSGTRLYFPGWVRNWYRAAKPFVHIALKERRPR